MTLPSYVSYLIIVREYLNEARDYYVFCEVKLGALVGHDAGKKNNQASLRTTKGVTAIKPVHDSILPIVTEVTRSPAISSYEISIQYINIKRKQ